MGGTHTHPQNLSPTEILKYNPGRPASTAEADLLSTFASPFPRAAKIVRVCLSSCFWISELRCAALCLVRSGQPCFAAGQGQAGGASEKKQGGARPLHVPLLAAADGGDGAGVRL
jgi:hypothetical protein